MSLFEDWLAIFFENLPSTLTSWFHGITERLPLWGIFSLQRRLTQSKVGSKYPKSVLESALASSSTSPDMTLINSNSLRVSHIFKTVRGSKTKLRELLS